MWSKLPKGFLRMNYGRWSRLAPDIQSLIVELASEQNFKCVLCSQARSLEVEHDHLPEFGPSDRYTVFNIRGLACRSCNWQIGQYEKELRGESTNWVNFSSRLVESSYYDYLFKYECRVNPLIEAAEKELLGVRNYWRRRLTLSKFDNWVTWEDKRKTAFPWHWGFDEIKDKKYGRIRNPKQAILTLTAVMRYVLEELKKNPDEPPEQFFALMTKVKPLFDDIRAAHPALRDLTVDR